MIEFKYILFKKFLIIAMDQRAFLGLGFKRMAKGVAQIEQGPYAAFQLILGDDARLEGDSIRNGLNQPVAGDRVNALRFKPFKQLGVPNEACLDDFCIAGERLAPGQGVEKGRVSDHQVRLMEGADQVLAVTRIDAGLAAHRAVDLRQQGGGNLDETRTALENGRGKAGQVPHRAAAKGDDGFGAFHIQLQQSVTQMFKARPGLCAFTAFDLDDLKTDARCVKRLIETGRMMGEGCSVRHHDGPAAWRPQGQPVRPARQGVAADHHFIGSGSGFDLDYAQNAHLAFVS